jgi:hypothetical protein
MTDAIAADAYQLAARVGEIAEMPEATATVIDSEAADLASMDERGSSAESRDGLRT